MFCSCVPLTSFLYFFTPINISTLLPLPPPQTEHCAFWVGNASTFDFQPSASILNARRVNRPVQQGWFSSGLGYPQNISQWQKLLTLPLHRTCQLSWQRTPFQMHFIFLSTWFLSCVQEQMVGCVHQWELRSWCEQKSRPIPATDPKMLSSVYTWVQTSQAVWQRAPTAS